MSKLVGTSEGIVVGAGHADCFAKTGVLDDFERTAAQITLWEDFTNLSVGPMSSGLQIYSDFPGNPVTFGTPRVAVDGSHWVATRSAGDPFGGSAFIVNGANWIWAQPGRAFTATAVFQSQTSTFDFGSSFAMTVQQNPYNDESYGGVVWGPFNSLINNGTNSIQGGAPSRWATGIWLKVRWNFQPGVLSRTVLYHNGDPQPATWDVTLPHADGPPAAQFSFGTDPYDENNTILVDYIRVDAG